jgi:hypothetical protein
MRQLRFKEVNLNFCLERIFDEGVENEAGFDGGFFFS